MSVTVQAAWHGGNVDPTELLQDLEARAAEQAPQWAVTGNVTSAGNEAMLNIELEHPASHGLIFSINAMHDDPHDWLHRAIENSEEISIVEASPDLEHPRLVLGLRNLIQGFRWKATEVRGLAFLLYATGGLSAAEAAWLSGYCGSDAPMEPRWPE